MKELKDHGIMNIKGRNNKEQKDAHIIRQHITRQTRDFFTTFNKTLSTMYAFFLLKYSKSYLHTCSLYVYLCYTEVSHPSQHLNSLNLRLPLVSSIFENEISLSLYTDNKRYDFRHQSATMNTV